tara:strand:- start:2718 stop:3029 length:312 start_codon:yes stop_codon:yes gene_type:complete
MSRGTKKRTAAQLTEDFTQLGEMFKSHEELISIVNMRIDSMAHAVILDFNKFNMLVMALLEELNYIESKVCACGNEYAWPNIGGKIPEPQTCADCIGLESEEE